MKKVLFIVIIASASFASCKKNRTCVCTSTAGGTSLSTSTTINDTKANAKQTCEAQNASTAGATKTCALK